MAYSLVLALAASLLQPGETPAAEDAYVAQGPLAIAALKAGRPAEALEIFERIDALYQSAYGDGKTFMCAHGPAERELYLKRSADPAAAAVAATPRWCDVIFYKAYSLVDLHRPENALAELDRVLAMEPEFPQYLAEKGELLMRAKRWDESIHTYQRAEADYIYAPLPSDQLAMRSRACRGVGYVLTEQHKLDEAEAEYRRCLTIDPNDQKSKNELAYIASLRGAH